MNIGLTGSHCEIELEIITKTNKAYKLLIFGTEEIWLPKSAFDENNVLKEWGNDMLVKNMEHDYGM